MGSELVHLDPLIKVGLRLPTSRQLKIIALASRVYHAIKLDWREEVDLAVRSKNFEAVLARCTEMCEYYANELRLATT